MAARAWSMRASLGAASAALPLGTLACAHLYHEKRASSFCDHKPNIELPGSWLKNNKQASTMAAASKTLQPQDKRVWRISYLSNVRGSVETARRTIDAAVEKLEKDNVERNITGHMCYDPISQQVWQVLEGTPKEIEKTWAAIQKEKTHDIVEGSVRFEDDADARRYSSGWGFSNFAPKSNANGSDAKLSCDANAEKNIIQLRYKAFVEQPESGFQHEVIPQTIKNSQLDVTGLLLFHENSLTTYQVLEGCDSDVEQLWETLQQDPRQRIVSNSVSMRAIPDRQFSELSVDEVKLCGWAVGPGY